MKLRMYLRGLGIGMAVSAVILSVAMPKQKAMSDAEIIAKAKELGMVEEGSTLVSVATPKSDNKSEEPEAEEAKIEEPKPEKAEVKEPEVEETEVKELKAEEPKLEKAEVKEPEVKQEEKAEEPKVEEPKEEEPKEESKADNSKSAEKQEEKAEKELTVNKKSVTTITIAGGSSSDVVARLLEKGGVIDSASKFDSYLCSHNLDHVICAGTHEIPAGADYETISKIITSR